MGSELTYTPLGDLCDPERGITYGIVKVGEFVAGGVPVIRGGDIRNGTIIFDEQKRVSKPPDIDVVHFWMLRLQLDEETKARLRAIRRKPDTPWWVTERVDMLLLAAEGWSVPRIARYLGCHAQTVRRVLKAFRSTRLEALERRLPGPEPDLVYRDRVERVLDDLLSQPRIWTAVQLSDSLAAYGVSMSPRQVRRYLVEMGARWRRTKNSLEHKQHHEQVRRARRQLTRLKKSPRWASEASFPG